MASPELLGNTMTKCESLPGTHALRCVLRQKYAKCASVCVLGYPKFSPQSREWLFPPPLKINFHKLENDVRFPPPGGLGVVMNANFVN